MNRAPLTRWDALKIIALLLMFVDHAGAFYYTDEQWLRGIGRACAPLFLFLAGFAPHYKFDKKLLALALLLTASDWLVNGAPNTLNILWCIILIRALFAWLEKRGAVKLKLHEWFISAIPFLSLLPLLQYSPFWLLFGLCGYVYKHQAHYVAQTPARFLAAVTIFYGVIYAWFSEFTSPTIMVMTISLALMFALMRWFVRAPTQSLPTPVPFAHLLKLCARQTALIYVVHLIAIGWLTGMAI